MTTDYKSHVLFLSMAYRLSRLRTRITFLSVHRRHACIYVYIIYINGVHGRCDPM